MYIGKHLKMFNVEEHQHDYYEIVYCTSGTGVFTFENQPGQITYKEGEAVLIPQKLIHTNVSSEGFSNIFIALSSWNLNINKITKVSDNENRDLLNIITQAYYYFNCDAPNKSNIITCQTELIFNYIISFIGINRASPAVENIIDIIINNFSNSSFCIDSALDKIPLSNEYLRKIFIKEKGISPLQFLKKMRIDHAAKLLPAKEQYDLTIKEISDACGFEDQLYFSRVFKQQFGLSPTEYVKSIKR
jgi:AraC family transcriptional regulator, L-rhamnose operon regulatory protein RhaS